MQEKKWTLEKARRMKWWNWTKKCILFNAVFPKTLPLIINVQIVSCWKMWKTSSFSNGDLQVVMRLKNSKLDPMSMLRHSILKTRHRWILKQTISLPVNIQLKTEPPHYINTRLGPLSCSKLRPWKKARKQNDVIQRSQEYNYHLRARHARSTPTIWVNRLTKTLKAF